VIFMHRQFSLQPFSRHYSHSTNPFLDFLQIDDLEEGQSTPRVSVAPEKRAHLLEVLSMYKQVQSEGRMHTLSFVTVNDYLWLLRAVSQEMACLGKNALFYLAAAVSDFFLPRQKMVRTSRSLDKAEANYASVNPQDPVGQGKSAYRDGPSA
jgi:phosphopantothenate---cysteine ligase (ATP)